jgi:general transcription factor 3C polypeptide 3 (transcription factor C subunit 4)
MEPEDTDSDDRSTVSQSSSKRKQHSQYPSPPLHFADYGQFTRHEDGDESEEEEQPQRPKKRLRFNLNEDVSMLEDSDEDSEAYEDVDENEDEDEILPSVEVDTDEEDDDEAASPREQSASVLRRGKRMSKPRAGETKEIWSRSKSERFGKRARDEEGRKIRRKRGKIDVYHETPELRRLTGLVTQAWMDEEWDTALMYALEAIKIQPEAFQLHGTVAEVLIIQGRYQDALDTLFTGVHASKIPANWWYVVDRLNEISEINDGRVDRAIGDKLQHCYSRIIDLEPKNYRARTLRMQWNLDRELYKRARNDCMYLLRLRPTDTYVVEKLAEVSGILEEPEVAVDCFSQYISSVLDSDTPESTTFTWSTLASYTELLLNAEQYREGMVQLQTLSRWLLGRAEETFWDGYSDDREWDVYPEDRREKTEQFILGRFDEDTYGFGLPLELRVRLGTLRLLSGRDQLDEAMVSPLYSDHSILKPAGPLRVSPWGA